MATAALRSLVGQTGDDREQAERIHVVDAGRIDELHVAHLGDEALQRDEVGGVGVAEGVVEHERSHADPAGAVGRANLCERAEHGDGGSSAHAAGQGGRLVDGDVAEALGLVRFEHGDRHRLLRACQHRLTHQVGSGRQTDGRGALKEVVDVATQPGVKLGAILGDLTGNLEEWLVRPVTKTGGQLAFLAGDAEATGGFGHGIAEACEEHLPVRVELCDVVAEAAFKDPRLVEHLGGVPGEKVGGPRRGGGVQDRR